MYPAVVLWHSSMLDIAWIFAWNLYGIVVHRYPTRIEAMVVKLEFSEKLEDIKPGIRTLEIAIDGNTLQLI